MTANRICPCPNIDCPNHGNCSQCSARHLKKGTLNYCGFYSILEKLECAIAKSPESETAGELMEMIKHQQETYSDLIAKHQLNEERQSELREDKRESGH